MIHISVLTGSDDILCVPKKVMPKFKSLWLRHILSELNILLAALIIILPM